MESESRYANRSAQMQSASSLLGGVASQNTRAPRQIMETLDAALKRLTGLQSIASDLSNRIGGPPAAIGEIMGGIGAEQGIPADLHSMAIEIERVAMTVESRLVASLNRL